MKNMNYMTVYYHDRETETEKRPKVFSYFH